MTDDTYAQAPIGEVLNGLTIAKFPKEYVVLDVVSIVKVLDEDGEVCWLARTSPGTGDLEALGALLVEVDRRRYHKASTFISTEDDE